MSFLKVFELNVTRLFLNLFFFGLYQFLNFWITTTLFAFFPFAVFGFFGYLFVSLFHKAIDKSFAISGFSEEAKFPSIIPFLFLAGSCLFCVVYIIAVRFMEELVISKSGIPSYVFDIISFILQFISIILTVTILRTNTRFQKESAQKSAQIEFTSEKFFPPQENNLDIKVVIGSLVFLIFLYLISSVGTTIATQMIKYSTGNTTLSPFLEGYKEYVPVTNEVVSYSINVSSGGITKTLEADFVVNNPIIGFAKKDMEIDVYSPDKTIKKYNISLGYYNGAGIDSHSSQGFEKYIDTLILQEGTYQIILIQKDGELKIEYVQFHFG